MPFLGIPLFVIKGTKNHGKSENIFWFFKGKSMRVLCKLMAAIIAIIFTFAQTAHAGDERPVVDWARKDIPGTELSPLDDDMFGERIDPHLGGVSFSVVDVSLPGNFDIPVEIRRTLMQGRKYRPTETAGFGDWELDIPRITYGYMGEEAGIYH